MKKLTAVTIVLALLLTLASCKEGTAVPEVTTTVTTVGTTTSPVTETTAPAEETTETAEETTAETTAPVEEPFNTEAFLSAIPVYEYSYEEEKHLDCLDRIGAEEYKKYAAGEAFSEYYAIRFTEYPDIAIIGQVVTEPKMESVYDQRVMDSVIRNGERHYLTENKRGPGFSAYITDDFVCITMAASGIGGAFYVYDGGAEDHTPSDALNDSISFVHLYEKDGTMQYMIYNRKYDGMRHSNGPLMYGDLKYEDHFYDKGTVQLIDGKIKYIADESYTVGEWYASAETLRKKSGCETVEEFSVWLKEYEKSKAWETDTEPLWLP